VLVLVWPALALVQELETGVAVAEQDGVRDRAVAGSLLVCGSGYGCALSAGLVARRLQGSSGRSIAACLLAQTDSAQLHLQVEECLLFSPPRLPLSSLPASSCSSGLPWTDSRLR